MPDYLDDLGDKRFRTPPFLPQGTMTGGYQVPDYYSDDDDEDQVPQVQSPEISPASKRAQALIEDRAKNAPKPGLLRKIAGYAMSAYGIPGGDEVLHPGSTEFQRQLALTEEQAKLEEKANEAQERNLRNRSYAENIKSQAETRRNTREDRQQTERDKFQQQGGQFLPAGELASDSVQVPQVQSPDVPAALPPSAPGGPRTFQPPPPPGQITEAPPNLGVSGLPAQPATRVQAQPGRIATPEGAQEVPGARSDPRGMRRVQDTPDTLLRKKKEAEQVNWAVITPELAAAVPEAGFKGGERTPKETFDKLLDLASKKEKDPNLHIVTAINEVTGDQTITAIDPHKGKVVSTFVQPGVGQHRPPDAGIAEDRATRLLDSEIARYAKAHEKGVADATTQLDKIDDAGAMINGSAEAQALGIPKVLTALVSGAGTGVRITQPELNSILSARGIQGTFEGFKNKLSGQGALTAQQQQQLTQILDDVKTRIAAKQAIAREALDATNSARSRDEVIRISKDAGKKLDDLSKPQQAKPAGVGLPPEAARQLKEGVHTTFGNGQTWTLQGGKPVQVK